MHSSWQINPGSINIILNCLLLIDRRNSYYLYDSVSCRLQTDLQSVGQLLRLSHLRHENVVPLLQITRQFQPQRLERIVSIEFTDLSTFWIMKCLRILLVRTSSEIIRLRPAFGSTCGTTLTFRYYAFYFTDLSGERLQTTSCSNSTSFTLVFLTGLIEASVVVLRMSGDSGSVKAIPSLPFLDLLLYKWSSGASLILGNKSQSSEFFRKGICRLFFRKLILFLAEPLISYLHLYQNSLLRFSSTCSSFQRMPTLTSYCLLLSSVERAPEDPCFFRGRTGEPASRPPLLLMSLPIPSRSCTKGMNCLESCCTSKPFLEVLMKLVGE